MLVLTGTAVLYAESFWAPTVINWLGGPQTAAIIHRIAAGTFIVLFFGHLIYFAVQDSSELENIQVVRGRIR